MNRFNLFSYLYISKQKRICLSLQTSGTPPVGSGSLSLCEECIGYSFTAFVATRQYPSHPAFSYFLKQLGGGYHYESYPVHYAILTGATHGPGPMRPWAEVSG